MAVVVRSRAAKLVAVAAAVLLPLALEVSPARALEPSTTISDPTPTQATVGEPVQDGAVILGQPSPVPTGTATFHVCGPLPAASGCPSGGAMVGSPVTVMPYFGESLAFATPFTPSTVGTYCFRADYSGDATYLSSSDSGANECFEVFDQIITGDIPGGVVVPAGETVLITGATIGGAVVANHAASVRICSSEIGGSVSVSHSTGPVTVGDQTDNCFPNEIGGSLWLTNNLSSVVAKNNTVAGAVVASGNASQDVSGNHH